MHLRQALAQARRTLEEVSDSPASDARLLLADLLGETPTWVMAHDDKDLPADAERRLQDRLGRCARGEPLPYVLGWWEFYGRRFAVTPEVLIPRPETEQIVERALAALRNRRPAARVIDVGTGSGCVAISLACEMPALTVVATDLSRGALEVARTNARAHQVAARVRLVQGSLLAAVAGPWDIVCANLPYVPTSRLGRLPVAEHEPRLALDGGPQGTGVMIGLVDDLGRCLAPGGLALMEIDETQGEAVASAARQALPGTRVEIRPDLAGRPRLIEARRGGYAD